MLAQLTISVNHSAYVQLEGLTDNGDWTGLSVDYLDDSGPYDPPSSLQANAVGSTTFKPSGPAPTSPLPVYVNVDSMSSTITGQAMDNNSRITATTHRRRRAASNGLRNRYWFARELDPTMSQFRWVVVGQPQLGHPIEYDFQVNLLQVFGKCACVLYVFN